jgi:phage terminase large subunit-like protein
MAWFKVDDGFYSSRKVLSIPRSRRFAAIGLWCACGSWTMKELTDGFVPSLIVEELGGTESMVADLVAATLWVEQKGGYLFWDWKDYQPSAASIKSNRTSTSNKRSEAGKKGAEIRWQNDGQKNGKTVFQNGKTEKGAILPSISQVDGSALESQNMAKWQSDGKANGKRIAPTRPDPTKDQEIGQKSGAPITNNQVIPKNWKPNENAVEFGKANSVNVAHEAEQFRNHSAATGRKMKNWDAAFRVWLGNSVKWSKPANAKAGTDDWMNS